MRFQSTILRRLQPAPGQCARVMALPNEMFRRARVCGEGLARPHASTNPPFPAGYKHLLPLGVSKCNRVYCVNCHSLHPVVAKVEADDILDNTLPKQAASMVTAVSLAHNGRLEELSSSPPLLGQIIYAQH